MLTLVVPTYIALIRYFQTSEPILRGGCETGQVAKEEFLTLKRKLEDLQSKHEIFAQLINQKVPATTTTTTTATSKEKKFLSQ